MYQRLVKLESRFHFAKTTIIIAVLTIISKVIGLLRDLLLASQLGLGSETDIYFTAFRIPDLIFNLLILGTLSAAFVPVFTKFYLKDKTQAWQIASSILNIAILGVGLISIVVFIFAGPLTKLIAPGFSPDELQQTINLTRILLLSPIIFTASSVFSSMLLSLKRFILINSAPLLYNISIIFGIIFLYPKYQLTGLAIGVICGALLHLLIQIPQARALGFRFKKIILWHHKGVKNIARLFVPRILGLDISYVNLIVVSFIGSALSAGSISSFNFANNIHAVALGVFAISISSAVFPVLAEYYAKNQTETFVQTLNITMVRILYFILPLSILMLLLRAHIVRLLLGYGKCDWTCTVTTLDALGVLSLGLIAQSLIPLLSRAYYARENTATPVKIGLVAIAFNVLLSYWFSIYFGITGVAFGFVIATSVQCILLLYFLHKNIKDFLPLVNPLQKENNYVVYNIAKITLASIFAGLYAYFVLQFFGDFLDTHSVVGLFTQALLATVSAGIIYLIITHLLNVPEAIKIKLIINKVTKIINIPGFQ